MVMVVPISPLDLSAGGGDGLGIGRGGAREGLLDVVERGKRRRDGVVVTVWTQARAGRQGSGRRAGRGCKHDSPGGGMTVVIVVVVVVVVVVVSHSVSMNPDGRTIRMGGSVLEVPYMSRRMSVHMREMLMFSRSVLTDSCQPRAGEDDTDR